MLPASSLRASLKKPGDVLDIIGPDLFDLNTWPEEEFYDKDPRQPWLYFLPQDPLIRRNPLGQRDLSIPPVFVADDAAAYTDFVKSTGDEFLVVYGETGPPPHQTARWFITATTSFLLPDHRRR